MFFSSNISIDPAQLTKIEKVKPQKAFKRILYFLTAGAVSDEEEHETFSAVSILQQLYSVFSSLGINNLVRLSHDDIDFYLDADWKKDDLKATLDLYDLKTNEAMSQSFQQLTMVLEHQEGFFKYLINITINRTHKVGVYPIDIFLDGLLAEFSVHSEMEAEGLKDKMSTVFKDQHSYDSFIISRQSEFQLFSDKIRYQINKLMRVTDVKMESKSKVIIPKESKRDLESFKKDFALKQQAQSPVFHGYYGFGDAFFYSYLWSSMMYQNHIFVQHTSLISEEGALLKDVGDSGLDAGDNSLFNPDEDYDSRLQENDLQYDENTGEYTDSDNGSWWGSDSTDFGDSSCSSCSSCGSCGG